jgi:high-affinity nickel-transport protein
VSLFTVLMLGLFLGVRHATDADHVVAVSTIVCREHTTRAAMKVGALWGLGHTLTIVLVGGAIVVFGLVIPARVGLAMEMAVAVMLVVLGGLNIKRALRRRDAAPIHSHSDLHAAPARRGLEELRLPLSARLRPLVVGIVHGLAGSAALALLVLTTIHDTAQAVLYLGVFGVGTVLGMALLTAVVALPVAAASRRFISFERWLAGVTGLLSLGFGLFLAYDIGFVEGLFLANETPHRSSTRAERARLPVSHTG